MPSHRSNEILVAIAVFKLIKGIALTAVGVIAVSSLHHDARAVMWVVDVLGIHPRNHYVVRVLAELQVISAPHLEELSAGLFVYGATFLVEGVGLLLRKRWAEYMTAIVSASFIPLELYELVAHFTWVKPVAVGVNVAIVIYLIRRLRIERRERALTPATATLP